jgi:tRNA 2-thiouridine synthesizing protein E
MRDDSRPDAGVELDEAGYLRDPLQWTPALAESLARSAGIARLTPRHWKVILCCRETMAREGTPPSLERIARLAGLGPFDLARLFPRSTGESVARLAGMPRPTPHEPRPHESSPGPRE